MHVTRSTFWGARVRTKMVHPFLICILNDFVEKMQSWFEEIFTLISTTHFKDHGVIAREVKKCTFILSSLSSDKKKST